MNEDIHGKLLYRIHHQITEESDVQKQPSRGVLMQRCSENMQQIYRRTSMPKYDFDKVTKQLY